MNCKEPLRRSAVVSGQIFPLVLALTVLLPQVALALTGSQVYERVKDSVVVVKAYDRAGKAVGLGSGVVLPSGDIVTNYHVVKAGVRYKVGQKGKAVPAFLQGSDPDKDLALLLAPGLTATPARLGQASRLKVGEPVYAVGAPQGLELSFSEGIVSQLRGGPPSIIQTTAAISPGSSGGGLFNAQGELVGIVTFYLKEGQSLNFALPVEWLEKKAGDYKGWLAHTRQLTRAEPNNPLAWFQLGLANRELLRYRDAIAAYKKALSLKPDYPEAWKELGNALTNNTVSLKSDHFGEAIEAYREALRLKPDYSESLFELGFTYIVSGNRHEALKAAKELRRYDRRRADILFHLLEP